MTDAWDNSDGFSFADDAQFRATVPSLAVQKPESHDAWAVDASFVDEIGSTDRTVAPDTNGVGVESVTQRTTAVQALIDELSEMTIVENDHTVNMTKEEAVVSFAATLALLRYDFNRIYGEHFRGDYNFATASKKFADLVKERSGDIGFQPASSLDGSARPMAGQARELLDHLVHVARRLHLLQVPERETSRLCQVVQDSKVFTPQKVADLGAALNADEYAPREVKAFEIKGNGGSINLESIFKLYSKTAEDEMRRETEISQVIAAKLQAQEIQSQSQSKGQGQR